MVGAKRAISTVLFKCVTCKKLRGKAECQQMGNLPSERMQLAPPFTYVGVDLFGPWDIITRRTRGGKASSKRWAVMFSCLSTRAVHIELIESMSTDCFINALRRLFAIRGPARQLRSDYGTNFIGASRELKMDRSSMSVKDVEGYLSKQNCSWIFNPPHASHIGGAWERIIFYCQAYPWLYVTGLQKSTTNTWTVVNIHGRSLCHHECSPSDSCVHWSWVTSHPHAVNAAHDETRLSNAITWWLWKGDASERTMEKSAKSCWHVLVQMETGIPSYSSVATQIAGQQTKSQGRGHRSAQRYSGEEEQSAHVYHNQDFPRERWTCQESRSKYFSLRQ